MNRRWFRALPVQVDLCEMLGIEPSFDLEVWEEQQKRKRQTFKIFSMERVKFPHEVR